MQTELFGYRRTNDFKKVSGRERESKVDPYSRVPKSITLNKNYIEILE